MSNLKSYQKFIAPTIIAAAVAATHAATPASADNSNFQDVSERYEAAVEFLTLAGIAQGYDDKRFGTVDAIKRSDAAVLIAKMIGIDEEWEYEESGFKDVPKRAKWAVDALYELRIIDGKNATTFGADELVTRNQIAKILANAAQLDIDNTVKTTQFKDVNTNFAKYVDALVETGITEGKTKNQFGAIDNVTRGEIALFLHRAHEYFGFMDLLVMHVNDSHAYLDRFPYIATAVNELRSVYDHSVLLHAGDVFSGDLYFNKYEGKADLDIMNHLKFDAMVFGNHEFDLGGSKEGHKALQEFVKGAKFPLLGANVDFSKDPLFDGMQVKDVTAKYENGKIYNGVVLNVNGHEIGVFGLTTEETPHISSTNDITFSNYIEEAKKSVAAFEELGIDKIIALTHLGFDDSILFDNDKELAKAVEGIDIIVGGHTHSKLTEPYIEYSEGSGAPTVIVQANEYGKALGVLDVSFNQYGEVYAFYGELINTDPTGNPKTEIKPDAKTTEILAPYAKGVEELKNQSIGKEAKALLDGRRAHDDDGKVSVRFSETNLGNIITDAMLAKAKTVNENTVIAIQNGGGIRTSIQAGDITVGDVLKVLPFGNPLAIMEVTGAEIKATLEHSVSADLREGGGLKENGGFLHVAGLKFEYDSTKAKGERVLSVKVKKGQEYVDLNDTEKYFVATNTFTARGGDGFEILGKAYKEGRVSEPGFSDYENLIEYMQSLDEVNPTVEGRIVDVALQNK